MTQKPESALRKAIEYFKSPRGESLRYLFVGGLTTFVDYAAYLLMARALGADITVSNVISTILAILFAYITNKLFVFQSRTASKTGLVIEFFKFIAARLLTMVLEIGGVFLFVNILGQDDRLGKLEAIVIVIIANYFLSKFLVFKELKSKRNQD
jgi:putative flippase GtrA